MVRILIPDSNRMFEANTDNVWELNIFDEDLLN